MVTVEQLPKEKLLSSPASPIRVLFVSHTYVVGINQGKLAAIADAGAEVALLVPKHWKASQWNKRFEVETPYPQIKMYPFPIGFEGRAGAHFYMPNAIIKAIADFRPDIIQIEEEVFSLVAFEVALAAKQFRIPVVLFGWENRDRQLSPLRRWMRQFVFDNTQCIIAGNHDGASLVRQWGYAKTVEIMPQMGVDTDLFSPRLRDRLLTATDLRIGYVGRIAHHKGIGTLLLAAYQLKQQGFQFQLYMCGSGPDEAKFKSLAKDYDLEERIVWRGGVRHDEVPAEIGQMDALVLPSITIPTWKEQFGHVLIEAMSVGIPVVGSTCGEIPNAIGEPALVFPEGDAEALVAVLSRLIQDDAWRQSMAQYSLDRVAQHYSHQRIAERLIELWQAVLQSA